MNANINDALKHSSPQVRKKIEEVLLTYPEMEKVFLEMLNRKTKAIKAGDKKMLEKYLDDEEKYLIKLLEDYQNEQV